MKKAILSFALGVFCLLSMQAAPKLPAKVDAKLPRVLLQNTITEKETNRLLKSGNWMQHDAAEKFWTVYSDRSHNTTYNSPSVSGGKCGELKFNEEVRIAEIQNDFALVYSEPKKGFNFPQISSSAESKGWIPMKNLLLWNSCPTDDVGIYHKALIVANLDKMKKGDTDFSVRFENPETRDNPKQLVASMDFFFIMKKGPNNMVLLATGCKMEGYTNQVLYGWTNEGNYVKWDQRTCIEPNWEPQVAEDLKGVRVNVTQGGEKVTDIGLGRENNIKGRNASNKYRLEPSLMRYPLIKADKQYTVTAFARPNGEGHVPTVPLGTDNNSVDIKEQLMSDANVINLIVVIDGTRSMEDYYQPMQEVIQKAYNTFEKGKHVVRVGVVIYRDYADGEYVTEMLSMRSPEDKSVESFLNSGGKYGIKSSPADRTDAEALFKGLEVALDANKMGYSPKNSNLMLVVGDCGNDLSDKRCLSQAAIIQKCTENRVQIVAFQVRNNSGSQAFSLFRAQMGDIIQGTLEAQGAFNVSGQAKAKFRELPDGYEYATKNIDRNFFIGAVRNAPMDKSMEVTKLYALVDQCYDKFSGAIEGRSAAINNVDRLIMSAESAKDATVNSLEMSFLDKLLSPEQKAAMLRNNTLTAFTGQTDIMSPKDQNYWQAIIYISHDEFGELLEKLEPVEKAALSGDRKPYVTAMKALIRSQLPDITEQEMDQMDTRAIMAIVAGLNVKSKALGGYTLQQIESENIVKPSDFGALVTNFSNKYKKLKRIHENNYPFSVMRNKMKWYWIPMSDLP